MKSYSEFVKMIEHQSDGKVDIHLCDVDIAEPTIWVGISKTLSPCHNAPIVVTKMEGMDTIFPSCSACGAQLVQTGEGLDRLAKDVVR